MSQQINLFNPIFLKQEKHFSALTMAQALGVILCGCIALTLYTGVRLSSLNKEEAAVSTRLAAVKGSLDKLNATYVPRQKTKDVQDQIATAEADIRSLQQVLATLQGGDMGDTKGYSEYMRAFARQIVDGVWLTGFKIQGAGNELEIDGRALRPDLVPSYLGRLRKEAVLQGKSFAALDLRMPEVKSSDKPGTILQMVPYIEFSLESSPNKGADDKGGDRR